MHAWMPKKPWAKTSGGKVEGMREEFTSGVR